MSRVTQEFYCAKSGGGCGGYFLAKINMSLNGVHKIICPNCKHDHRRRIKDGHIIEEKRFDSAPVDEIYPTKATYRSEPYTKVMKDRPGAVNERDSVIISSSADLIDKHSHWVEIFGDRR